MHDFYNLLQVLLPFVTGISAWYLSNKKTNHDYLKDENDRLIKRIDVLTERVDKLTKENDKLRKELNDETKH